MTPERWEKVRDVLGQVLEVAPEKRPQFLNDACADDASLRGEVESLLSSDENARSSFLQSPPISPTTLTNGTRLGDYEIVSLVGSGGMGEVYRARDTKLKREVAIKVLPAYWSRDPERLERFELEARAAAALNHPNITSIFHVGQHDGSPYIVTELLQGETLRERLRKGPVRLHEALDYGAEIARGLGAAHDAGVIHRDLKPENIFVTKDGRIKILDFGLAKLQVPKTAKPEDPTVIPRQTNPGQVLGTVGYMSPEQVRGHSTDARSDIFAAGAVLYEMLTGKPAFRKATSAETMSAILNEDPPPVSQVATNVPPGLQRIVNRCLTKNPDQRFQHASDLAFALEALSASSSGTVSSLQEPTPSRKWIWIATSAATLGIAAAAIIWWNRPAAVPVVEGITQLTDDGVPKQGPLMTDGSRIYFNEGATGSWSIAQVSVAGGETSLLTTKLLDPQVAAITSDGSSLLAFVGEPSGPLWRIPLPSGEPRQLGKIEAQGADFFQDGQLLFTNDTGLFVARPDGSDVRKLLAASDEITCPRPSPDGKRIVVRFWNQARSGSSSVFLEAASDGSHLREIMRAPEDARGSPGATVHVGLGCLYWTPDGKYLIYRVISKERFDVWAVAVGSGLSRRYSQRTQLTNGPLSYDIAVPSRDGKQIFAIGTKRRGELVRYDTKTKQFVPFLGGMSAIDPQFSRDGQWTAYTSYPDHTLWRCRADGTDRLQLTYPPMQVKYPFISQDGRRVSFKTDRGELYVIDMNGDSLRKIAENSPFPGAISPDGNVLVRTVKIASKSVAEKNSWELQTIDLRNGTTSIVPSSKGMMDALWPMQDTLVAVNEDATKIFTFSFRSRKWIELASGAVVNWMTSPDGAYLYYTTGGSDPKTMRLRLADHKTEEIASLKDLRRVVDSIENNTQLSVAPDGSPVFARDIGTQEIYALTVRWP